VGDSWFVNVEGWINPGGSVIVDPDAKILAGPANEVETILYADVRQEQLVGPRWQIDIAGHYARPDVFELIVHRRPAPMIQERDASFSSAAPPIGHVGGERRSKKHTQPAKTRQRTGFSSLERKGRYRGECGHLNQGLGGCLLADDCDGRRILAVSPG
jgi:hypothetical protein